MNRKLLFIFTAIVFVAGCTQRQAAYPFTHIETKKEGANEMHLYAISGELNNDTLVGFCNLKTRKFIGGEMYYMVFFDSVQHASFPKGPLTGGYIDAAQLIHIKAIYTYNFKRNFASLIRYDGAVNYEVPLR